MRLLLPLLVVCAVVVAASAGAEKIKNAPNCFATATAEDRSCRVTRYPSVGLPNPVDGGTKSNGEWSMACGTSADLCGQSVVCECPCRDGGATRSAVFAWTETDGGPGACWRDFQRVEDAGRFFTTLNGVTAECFPRLVTVDTFTPGPSDGGRD
jgi:hypothetical protein